MKKIEAFKTDDGIVFEKEAKAIEHEALCGARNDLLHLCDRMDLSIHKEKICNFILDNRYEVWNILNLTLTSIAQAFEKETGK